MADYAVSTVFTGKDGVTDKLKGMAAAARKFGGDADGAFHRASAVASQFKATLGAFLSAHVITRGIGLLTQGVRGAIDEYVKLNDVITASGAIFGGYQKGSRIFEQLQEKAREIGATTEYSAVQAAEGLRFLAKAGYEPAFAMQALKSFVDLAAASEEEFASATSMASDILGAFRLNTGTTEERLTKLRVANDVLVKTVNMSNLSLTDLFETIKFAGPVAVDAGVSLEKFGAIAAFVGGAGIKGSLAGTAMRSALLSLTGQSKKVREEFGKLGVKFKTAAGDIRDPVAVFEDLRKKMEKMGTAQRLAILGDVFGERAISGVSVSIAGGAAALGKYEQALLNTKGESAKTADMMRQSIGKRLDILKNSALDLGFKFIEAFEDKIPGGIDAAAEAVRKFDVKSAIEGVKNVAIAIDEIWKAIDKIKPLVITFVGIKTIFAVIGYYKELKAAIMGAEVAQWSLNAAITANPIGGAIIAVGLLGTSLYMVYKNWDDIVEVTSFFADMIHNKILADIEAMKKAFGGLFEDVKAGYRALFGGGEGGSRYVPIKEVPLPEIPRVTERPAWEPLPTQSKLPQKSPFEIEETATSQEAERGEVARQKAESERLIGFYGELNIKGAPPGSTMKSKTRGAPPININGLGPNL